jgi:hypothetical protein
MDVRGPLRLLGEVHRHRARMAVAAFQESLAFRRAHSCWASSSRMSRNFSRVLIVPKILPQTSFEACILRAILSVHLCGTWQSGQVARTPERLEKCTVLQLGLIDVVPHLVTAEVQNLSVLVSSSAVLKPPQNITPATKPAERQERRG